VSDQLERDVWGSQEHTKQGCWCRHEPADHRWDAARDYRELLCLSCKAQAERSEQS
jgi:hypothetical protein